MKLNIDKFVNGHSITCVVIGFEDEELKILILKWKEANLWTLPVGFVGKNVSLDQAAVGVLENRTGLKLPYLEQFYTFGSLERRKNFDKNLTIQKFSKISEKFGKWVDQRFIGTGYLSLVDISKCQVSPDELSESCEWIALKNLPELLYDHSEMVEKAIEKLRMQINYLPIGITLLPEKFTMRELRKLYESILNKELDRGNFQKKILKLNILVRCEKQLNGGAHKAPYLYKFDCKAYKSLLEKGFGYIS